MPFATFVQRAFAGGELDPALAARADLAKYQTGLRTCRNFLVQRQGGVTNRPGTRLVAETKLSAASDVVLQPFVFAAADQSYAIECGDLYFRFHYKGALVHVAGVAAYNGATAYVQGDLVVSGGVNYYAVQATTGHAPPNATYWYPLPGTIYEIPTPYVVGRFKAPAPACFEQSGTVITITHLNEPPRELQYAGATRWVLKPVSTVPTIAAPINLAYTLGIPGPGPIINAYVVTAAKADTYEESLGSTPLVLVGRQQQPTPSTADSVTWDAVAGAVEYYVYKDPAQNGTFGYVATVPSNAFFDTGFTPDFERTPPVGRTLFAAPFTYPGVVTTYQQRRIFGGTHTDREIIEASVVGRNAGFGIHSPIQDDDAVSFKLAGTGIHPVHHLIGLERLVLLTDCGEWTIEGDAQGALTPTTINPMQHGYVGASFTRPVVVGKTILFVQARGRILRDLVLNEAVKGLSGRDLSVYSWHLFKRRVITGMAYAPNPHSIVWAVRDDGTLLGLTYLPEEDIWGWHRHDTVNGSFESVCVIPEDDEDAVYVVVTRTIAGVDRRFIERFAARDVDDVADGCFLDCAVTYDGAPATVISGLDHLNGTVVSVLADGVVPSPATYTVSGGSITLPTAASVVHVGLGITADLETLDLDVATGAGTSVRDKRKRVVSVSLLLEESGLGFLVGPDLTTLRPVTGETWESTTALFTGLIELNPTSAYTSSGRLLLRHTAPLPLTVLGLLPVTDMGG